MSHELLTFNGLSERIRVVGIDGLLCFAAKGAWAVLAHSKSRQAVARHGDPKQVRNSTKRDGSDTHCSNLEMILVNEAGLYDLLFASKLPAVPECKHRSPVMFSRQSARTLAASRARKRSPLMSRVKTSWFSVPWKRCAARSKYCQGTGPAAHKSPFGHSHREKALYMLVSASTLGARKGRRLV